MHEKMSIGEFAKLRNISTETLRHYDRYGLLKPIYIDNKTGYRYYSIFQYEKLSTILELRQLGMNLSDIKNFLGNRNLESSLTLLKNRHEHLKEELKQLHLLEERIAYKINHLKKSSRNQQFLNCLDTKYLSERKALFLEKDLNKSNVALGYVALEKCLKEISPIFAENKYGIKIKHKTEERFLFILVDNNIENKISDLTEIQTIPAVISGIQGMIAGIFLRCKSNVYQLFMSLD